MSQAQGVEQVLWSQCYPDLAFSPVNQFPVIEEQNPAAMTHCWRLSVSFLNCNKRFILLLLMAHTMFNSIDQLHNQSYSFLSLLMSQPHRKIWCWFLL